MLTRNRKERVPSDPQTGLQDRTGLYYLEFDGGNDSYKKFSDCNDNLQALKEADTDGTFDAIPSG